MLYNVCSTWYTTDYPERKSGKRVYVLLWKVEYQKSSVFLNKVVASCKMRYCTHESIILFVLVGIAKCEFDNDSSKYFFRFKNSCRSSFSPFSCLSISSLVGLRSTIFIGYGLLLFTLFCCSEFTDWMDFTDGIDGVDGIDGEFFFTFSDEWITFTLYFLWEMGCSSTSSAVWELEWFLCGWTRRFSFLGSG